MSSDASTCSLPLEVPTAARAAWADRLGVAASVGCVVHCLLTPVLLSCSALFAHLLPSEESTHRVLAVVVAGVGAVALVRGLRQHRKRRVALLMACGLLLIVAGAVAGDRLPSHGWEVLVTACGSVLMIVAHRLNHTFCAASRCARKAGAVRPGGGDRAEVRA